MQTVDLEQSDADVGQKLKSILSCQNIPELIEGCEQFSAFHGNNYLPLLWKIYRNHRKNLFCLVNSLEFSSTSRDNSMLSALEFLIENQNRKSELPEPAVDLSFAEEKWREAVLKMVDGLPFYDRKMFEVCVFSHLAQELKSGDIAVIGSEDFGDYRDGLLDWIECEPLVKQFCTEVDLPANPADFVARLKEELSRTADEIDKKYPKNSALSIDENHQLTLKKIEKQEISLNFKKLENFILERMPERNLLDILSNVQFHTEYMRHFGPLSGSDPKLSRVLVKKNKRKNSHSSFRF